MDLPLGVPRVGFGRATRACTYVPLSSLLNPVLKSSHVSSRLRLVSLAHVRLCSSLWALPPFEHVVPRGPAPSPEGRRSGSTVPASPFFLFFLSSLLCRLHIRNVLAYVLYVSCLPLAAPPSSSLLACLPRRAPPSCLSRPRLELTHFARAHSLSPVGLTIGLRATRFPIAKGNFFIFMKRVELIGFYVANGHCAKRDD